MPPKRSRPVPKKDEVIPDEPEPKKISLEENKKKVQEIVEPKEEKKPIKKAPKKKKVESSEEEESESEEENESEGEEDLPVCMYGDRCYRKNPNHLKEFFHPHVDSNGNPKKVAKKSGGEDENVKKVILDEGSNGAIVNNNSNQSPPKVVAQNQAGNDVGGSSSSKKLEDYRNVMQFALLRNKISAEDKRKLREFRRSYDISNEDHIAILKKFGWTEDEYEDGEKKEDDIDLQEERKILDSGGFQIITIRKEDANKNKEFMNTFAKVSTKFYDTMSKAQANYSVTAVGVVVNAKQYETYNKKKMELNHKNGKDSVEEWGFHGTTQDSILKISQGGFLHPQSLKQMKLAAPVKKAPKKGKYAAKAKPVELLDDGYFGYGIYFTKFSDYAMWYSEERNSDQVLLSKIAVGKQYQCNQRMDGQGLVAGHDSHTSPKGNEIVIFNPEQILPRYVITFVTKEAKEREQES
eukprot:TRINITY_DN4441_c0_g2_i1.p1 TRINITY_DN4441_c0_g2~~TRINITY_DN4441_c0_g2_i1.p1  ORF type:complete len:465 (+),score=181.39 TRINITY_DN4441_c0_g2_i1:163-1557(+)